MRYSKQMSFDAVIPCGPKDEDIIQRCIEGARANMIGLRYIFVVAQKKLDLSGAVVFEESVFPFKRDYLLQKLGSDDHASQCMQQLVKLYAPLLISSILENVVVLDADMIFYKRVKFLEQGRFLMDKVMIQQTESHFVHMNYLHPTFKAWKKMTSGSVSHALFNRKVLIEIMDKVEVKHNKSFWDVYSDRAGGSEYEIYFHYIMNTYPALVRIRPLRWNNFGQRASPPRGDWDCVTYHWQIQKKPTFL